jgi:hypothetical protein
MKYSGHFTTSGATLLYCLVFQQAVQVVDSTRNHFVYTICRPTTRRLIFFGCRLFTDPRKDRFNAFVLVVGKDFFALIILGTGSIHK